MPADNPPLIEADEASAAAVSRALRLENFFPEFGAEHCRKLFPRSGACEYAEGAVVIEQGESGRDLFVVLSGALAVRVTFGSAGAEVASLGPGSLLGEMALLEDGVRRATVVAVAPSRLFRLSFPDLGYILANNAELAAHLRGLARERA